MNRKIIAVCILVLAIVLSFSIYRNAKGGFVSEIGKGVQSVEKSIPEIASNSLKPAKTRAEDDGDFLVLVNKSHAVSKDYYPDDMVPVDNSLSSNDGQYFKKDAYDAYRKMLAAAKADGRSFLICSAYRSYDLQKKIHNRILALKGSKYANLYSALPGRSEHHTGYAVDITSESMNYELKTNFYDYPEGRWIRKHCSEYGFILRYPKGKTAITGYAFEPWHLRYVGVDVAKEITEKGITLEEYLGE